MRQSQLFTRTRKDAPSDEVSKNAKLLIRAGYIHKEMAGVYTYLPLGLRTLGRLNTIIREEMNAIGGQEVMLSSLQDKAVWEATGRWESADVEVWFKTSLQNGQELGLGFTHEEPITRMMSEQVASYRDLPQRVYQIQTKFRNEVRAKSGIMRTREFPMKDLYSFDRDQAGLDVFYEEATAAYIRIFSRAGIGTITYKTFASGGSFSKYSHEFQTVSDAGEDLIYIDKAQGIAINEEVYTDAVLADLGCAKDTLVQAKSIEVGNIFKLGTKFSEPLGLRYKDEQGIDKPVIMGCYGIGPSRLMGTIAEVMSDERGLVWPKEVAPFDVHVVRLGEGEHVVQGADTLVATLSAQGVSVLYDDRDLRAGEKFADSDLLGIPLRVVVSEKNIASTLYEVVHRRTGEKEMLPFNALLSLAIS
ncbi:MAG: prolyl-tRNA synthetase [Candidatus Pacebacteria bacterium]|nr:prolyl-tRNA synthetase [Candidatus Paceibacterota bacterium]